MQLYILENIRLFQSSMNKNKDRKKHSLSIIFYWPLVRMNCIMI
jgi:hypothetical protein